MTNAKGLEWYERVLAKPAPPEPHSGLTEVSIEQLFAKIWSRGGISIRDRRIITIALLASQGRAEQLRDHIRGARLGEDPLSEEEIGEILIQVAHYAGWAAGASGQAIARSVFSETRNSGG